MKENVVFFVALFLFNATIGLYSQNISVPPPCGLSDGVTQSLTPSPPNTVCIPTGVTTGANVNPNYIPAQNSDEDVITIELVFHSFGRFENDPQNFTENERFYFKDLVNVLNSNIYGEINCPTFNNGGACNCDDTYCEIEGGSQDCCINDSKIRFTLADEDIYFWTDELAWSGDGPGNTISGCTVMGITTSDYVDQRYAQDDDCKINVYFINTKAYSGCGPGYSNEQFDFVLMSDAYERYVNATSYTSRRQAEAGNIAHELGHHLGLHHVWIPNQQTLFSPELPNGTFNDFCSVNTDANCSNNVMDYSSIQNWFSPLQIAHMHRVAIGSWRSKTTGVEYDPSLSQTITSNEQWDFGRVNRGNITVTSGATLTITCKVLMASKSKITVEPGGKLIIDGGHLSMGRRECDDQWQGIKIVGNPNASQFPFTNQGEVEIRNGGMIEFADIGIEVGSGGIVDAINGTIKDCNTGVKFRPYDNFLPSSGASYRNISRFNNFAFTITDDFLSNSLGALAELNQIDGIIFSDCTFDDSRTVALDHIEQTSRGIIASNAGFRVNNGSVFQNLFLGVEAGSFNDVRTFSIRESTFNNCYVGLQSNGVQSIVLRDNNFQVGGYDLGFNVVNGIGATISNGTNFIVRDNSFTGSPGFTFGLTINNTGSSNNNITHNSFESLSAANYASGINVDLQNPFVGGLEYLCNSNTLDNLYDFFVFGEGISLFQGEETSSAGNTFNLNLSPAGSDFTNNNTVGFPINYWHSAGVIQETPNNTEDVFLRPGDEAGCSGETDDEDDSLSPSEKQKYLQAFQSSRTLYLSLLATLDSRVDGGNTPGLIQKISGSTTSSLGYQALINDITSFSPYLSRHALQEISQNNSFTTQFLLSTAQANPDLLKYGDLVGTIATARGLSPQQEQDLRNTGAVVSTTERYTLERSISAAFGEMQFAGRKLLVDLLADENEVNWLVVRDQLELMEDLPSLYALFNLNNQIGELVEATDLINNAIPTLISNNVALTNDHNDFLSIQNIYTTLVAANASWEDLSTIDRSTLSAIRDSKDNLAASQAQHLINFYFGERDITIPTLPSANLAVEMAQGQASNGSQYFSHPSEDWWINARVVAYPNPASNQVNFRYQNIDQNLLPVSLEVMDITGKLLLKKAISTSSGNIEWIAPSNFEGIVTYSIRSGEVRMRPQKLVIIP